MAKRKCDWVGSILEETRRLLEQDERRVVHSRIALLKEKNGAEAKSMKPSGSKYGNKRPEKLPNQLREAT